MTRSLSTLALLALTACSEEPEAAPEAAVPERSEAAAGDDPAPEEAAPLPGEWATRSPHPEVAEALALLEADGADEADEARARLDARILAAGDDADAFFVRGRVNAAEEAWDAAAADFKAAWKLDGTFHDARRWHAHALTMQKRCEAALPLYEELLVAWPEDASTWFNQGHCLFAHDRFDEASVSAKRACELGMDRACRTVPRIDWAKGKALEAAPGPATPGE